MGHIPSGKQAVPCDTMGGLCTNANPSDLPEGASPWAQDVDYVIGSVFTRPGLVSLYTYGLVP